MRGECLHVHSPSAQRVRRVFRCARCRVSRRHVVTVYEWYVAVLDNGETAK